MKKINCLQKGVLFLIGMIAFGLLSCKDELPDSLDTSDKYTTLRSIKILNTGAEGNQVLEGTIDEQTKRISFPQIDPSTDFSSLRFEADLPAGAALEQNVFAVVFPERVYVQTFVLKVVNNPRVKEYFVAVEQVPPPVGADFSDYEVYDFSNNPLGAPKHPGFVGAAVRGFGFDGQNVLLVPYGGKPSVLAMEDLRSGNINNPVYLNTSGVSGGGIFNWLTGYMIDGRVYMGNLTGGSALKLYYYENIHSSAVNIMNVSTSSVAGIGANIRMGDLMNVNISPNGSGNIYFADNNNTITSNKGLLRVNVSNFTNISNPTLIKPAVGYAAIWDYYNRVGTTSSYLYTTHNNPIVVADASGNTLYSMPSGILPNTASDPRIIEFNNSRYLTFITAPYNGNAVFYMYDLSGGQSIKEAFEIFSAQAVINPIFQYSLGSETQNGGPIVHTTFAIEQDEDGNDTKLSIFAAAVNNGFAVFEFPNKKL